MRPNPVVLLGIILAAVLVSVMKPQDGICGQVVGAAHSALCSAARTGGAAGFMSGYALDMPDVTGYLPDGLEEASGVTDVSQTQVAIVQDEAGVIYIFDILGNGILREIPFAPPGDYEDVTCVNGTVFVLESSGCLFEIRDWTGNAVVAAVELGLPTGDYEGLCHDPVTDKLLIAPKSRRKEGAAGKTRRSVFSVDIGTGVPDPEPFVVVDTDAMTAFAVKRGVAFPERKGKKGRKRAAPEFRPAALAVHPVTHDIYIVSAADNVLASFDRTGNVTGLWLLDRKRFPQPEGITFLPDASMVIVSEAGGRRPCILVFVWNP